MKLGLQDVLYNPDNGMIFTPNMGLKADINDVANGKASSDPTDPPDVIASGNEIGQTQPDPADASGKEKPNEDNDKG